MRLLTPGLMSRDYAHPPARVKHAGNLLLSDIKNIPRTDALQNNALSLSLRCMASAKPYAPLGTRVIYCGDNDTVHPRCIELARVLKKTGSFYYPG